MLILILGKYIEDRKSDHLALNGPLVIVNRLHAVRHIKLCLTCKSMLQLLIQFLYCFSIRYLTLKHRFYLDVFGIFWHFCPPVLSCCKDSSNLRGQRTSHCSNFWILLAHRSLCTLCTSWSLLAGPVRQSRTINLQ